MYNTEMKTDASTASRLPKPTGYRILIAIPKVEEKTEGGIIRPDKLLHDEGVASVFGYVLAVGPDAYSDKRRFPGAPYCKEGQWVMFRSYSGTRFKIDGQEFRLINDDTVEGIVDDPRGIERA